MSYLSAVITYSDVIRWGALQFMSAAEIERLAGGASSMTVGNILRLPLDVKTLACAVMHEEVIPARKMHKIGAALADDVLDHLTADGIYVDFRTRRAITAKRAWADNAISLGELNLALGKADRALTDIWELQNERVTAGAELALSVASTDSRIAVLSTLAAAVDAYGTRESRSNYLRIIEQQLEEE